MAEEFSTLEEFRAAVAKDLTPEVVAALDPLIAQRIDGALTLVNQKLAEITRLVQQFGETHAQARDELKASIPRMPDMTPIEHLCEILSRESSGESENMAAILRAVTDLSGSIKAMMKSHEQMCAQMDRPTVREGTAQLPSGGEVKLRIVESKGK